MSKACRKSATQCRVYAHSIANHEQHIIGIMINVRPFTKVYDAKHTNVFSRMFKLPYLKKNQMDSLIFSMRSPMNVIFICQLIAKQLNGQLKSSKIFRQLQTA